MVSIVLRSLSVLLGTFFIFVGLMKLTPRVSKEMYREIRKDFVKYAKVFPMANLTELKVPVKWYRRIVGGAEVACGIAMAAIPHEATKLMANVILLLLTTLMAYSHYAIDDKFERIAPSLVFFFMLSCRLIVAWQISKRKRAEVEKEAAKVNGKKD